MGQATKLDSSEPRRKRSATPRRLGSTGAVSPGASTTTGAVSPGAVSPGSHLLAAAPAGSPGADSGPTEAERLAALRSYGILDTLPEPCFDELAQLAAKLCGTPIAAMSLVDEDRQWFKASVGLEVTETPRSISFCAHALGHPDDVMVVRDALHDPRFWDNPLVVSEPGVRSYVGAPLRAPGGTVLGTLCALDLVPREFSGEQLEALRTLADTVMYHLEARRALMAASDAVATANGRSLAEDRSSSDGQGPQAPQEGGIVEKLAQAFEVLPVGMSLYDTGGMCLAANSAFAELVGRSPAQVVGMHLYELTAEGDSERERQFLMELKSGVLPSLIRTKRYVKPDGALAEAMVSTSVIRDGKGQPSLFCSRIEDITDRRRAETALLESYSLLDAVVTTDAEGRILSWNRGAEALLGWTESDTLGRTFDSFVPYDIPASACSPDARSTVEPGGATATGATGATGGPDARGSQCTTEAFVTRADGTPLTVELVTSSWSSGESVFHTAVLRDLSERKAGIAALAESEDRHRHLVEDLAEVVFSLDADLRVAFLNHAWEELTGYPVGSTIGTKSCSFLHEDERERAQATLRNLLEPDGPVQVRGELRWVRKDGTERCTELRARPRVGPSGKRTGVTGTLVDITDRKRAELKMLHQALHDNLTNLPNRALLVDRLDGALRRSNRAEGRVAVLVVNLVRFKAVNDSLGHGIGDQVIAEVASRIREAVRDEDTVARLGGDEFAVVAEGMEGPAEAVALAERVLEGVAVPLGKKFSKVTLNARIGIAFETDRWRSADEMLGDAAAAMYQAKRSASSYELFDAGMRAETRRRLSLETSLRSAIDDGSLLVHYQPEIEPGSHRLRGFEALVRWHLPGRGLVPPDEFVPLAEETGLIVGLGRWMLRSSLAQMVKWSTEHPGSQDLFVAVNCSAQEIGARGFPDEVRRALTESGVEPRRLCLEITERIVLGDTETTLRNLSCLRDMGVRLAMDDFGTGYSSLTYLQKLPIDTLKIDRSFVGSLSEGQSSHALVKAIVDMAKALGLTTVAEGVETEEQLHTVADLGCSLVQGYYLSRPLPPEKLVTWLNEEVRCSTRAQ
ncbi:MAG: EAL domain-containing protein [Actinomycetota bacterium]|nr:EAL domain-containing protein [Actinomycetota bacterium]